jgi:hypothetical protein
MSSTNNITPTPESSLDPEFVQLCKSVQAKRARTVIDHILEKGMITNEELSELYGYDHPPRAIRDVRENGIPLVTHSIVSNKTGRKIGAYTFGNPTEILRGRIGGRKAFSKQFKKDLLDRYGEKDEFTREAVNERYLQIDHRVPYQVAGDGDNMDVKDYMLIDASSQRAKSWSCEHCANFTKLQDISVCQTCFWAYPESYTHIAMTEQRRLEIIWNGLEVMEFDKIKTALEKRGLSLQNYIKDLLRK